MIYGHRTEEVALRRKWYDDEFLVVQWGAGWRGVPIHGKSNIQINFRANLTYLFRAGLKVIDHHEHPDDADEDDQFDVATHDALSFLLSLSLSIYLCIFISLVIGQQLLRTFSLLLFLCWGLTIWFGNTFWRRCISLCKAESIHSFINCTLNKYTNTHTRIRTTNTHTHCA